MRNILITGGEHNDRLNHALILAQNLLCLNLLGNSACNSCVNCQRIIQKTHPNIFFMEPGSSEAHETSNSLSLIKIDQVRRIIEENHKANFEQGVGIFIITHMHRITKSAANALLKAIEESHKEKIFLALAPSRTAVLKTIASRMICRTVSPTPLAEEKIVETIRSQIINISKTHPLERFSLCSQFSAERDELLRDLETLLYTCHTMLRRNEIYPRFALVLLSALNQAINNLKKNLNPRLIVEYLVLSEWPLMDR